MAKESTQTRALTGPRQLTMMIPQYQGLMGASDFPGFKGWKAGSSTTLVFYETYFDLSGYSLSDLTAVPVSCMLQDPGLYTSTDNKIPIQVLDILSQERLDPLDVFNNLTVDNNVPGMMETTNNFEQITFGNYRLFLPNLSFTNPATLATNVYSTVDGMNFGSGDPITIEKLWVYRFVIANGATAALGTTLDIPASRFVFNVQVVKEKDLEYIMRLKRSYELDQED